MQLIQVVCLARPFAGNCNFTLDTILPAYRSNTLPPNQVPWSVLMALGYTRKSAAVWADYRLLRSTMKNARFSRASYLGPTALRLPA